MTIKTNGLDKNNTSSVSYIKSNITHNSPKSAYFCLEYLLLVRSFRMSWVTVEKSVGNSEFVQKIFIRIFLMQWKFLMWSWHLHGESITVVRNNWFYFFFLPGNYLLIIANYCLFPTSIDFIFHFLTILSKRLSFLLLTTFLFVSFEISYD